MRFYLQQSVMCLAYEHPLLLERSRGWAPKNHFLAVENSERPYLENGATVTAAEPEDLARLEGEGGPETPGRATELIAVPLENTGGQRLGAP